MVKLVMCVVGYIKGFVDQVFYLFTDDALLISLAFLDLSIEERH